MIVKILKTVETANHNYIVDTTRLQSGIYLIYISSESN